MNIDGVIVLAQKAIVTRGTLGSFLLIATAMFTIILFASYAVTKKYDKQFFIAGSIFALMFFITILLGILGVFNKDTGRYEYKCTIADGASIHKIYDSYEIIAKEGQIWTLVDREVD